MWDGLFFYAFITFDSRKKHAVSKAAMEDRAISALMQRFGGAGFCAFVTENALSCVFSLARFFVDFDIHRTNLQALATMDAFIFITMDAQKRKVAHRLKKYCNRT